MRVPAIRSLEEEDDDDDNDDDSRRAVPAAFGTGGKRSSHISIMHMSSLFFRVEPETARIGRCMAQCTCALRSFDGGEDEDEDEKEKGNALLANFVVSAGRSSIDDSLDLRHSSITSCRALGGRRGYKSRE